ncbi:MAG: YdeI/OmpD-associated family protein, partial [Ignavibacteria bacterium]
GFKGSFVVSFFNGVLLSDPQNILEFAGPNSKTAKLIRFTNIEQIKPREDFLRAYIAEAIVHNVVDRKPDVWTPQPVSIPNELETMFQALPALKTAFYALTPGRQRGYLMHFGAAKQSATRRARIEKHVSSIMAGKGLHD